MSKIESINGIHIVPKEPGSTTESKTNIECASKVIPDQKSEKQNDSITVLSPNNKGNSICEARVTNEGTMGDDV